MWLTSKNAVIHLTTGSVSAMVLLVFSYYLNFLWKMVTIADRVGYCIFLLVCCAVAAQLWYSITSLCVNHCSCCRSSVIETPPESPMNIMSDEESPYPYFERDVEEHYFRTYLVTDVIRAPEHARHFDPSLTDFNPDAVW